MNVTCVIDDAVQRSSPFWGEHGLAFLIETEAGRVLFDTGQSSTVLLHNLEVLGVDPATIDALAISHAHTTTPAVCLRYWSVFVLAPRSTPTPTSFVSDSRGGRGSRGASAFL
jgi:hypothetical protein